ncbi:muscle M-line assembly protein unc-89 [Tribolium castaneum]|uniref:Uncharacterized protein n=1 Tax=Tribolium castaneum TaxID=7070 RepID=D6WGG3_TRICA|nr:PREDICTED: muscle M-line assembly protein unc-89 [Tribolium castaneum]XP_015833340.1 PREDICTED: muscle M-line assembly protein unc-89 [Tribolium castaneum]EFA00180.1 hypothetical protein TcasGA2_TC003005 [Tribolium castaneum]|eukprot:XP_008190866.1 PREDICTED: muscle M-line assembly protein unc-89 [Tribolium castaneum]
MPRKTPVKELQKEEPVVSSPLRRSTRLSTSSPVPTKVITRRNSASEATTSTPKATRGRRSSFSQELESNKEKSITRKGSASSSVENDEKPVARPTTRSSSVTKEITTEVKRTTRRRRSVTDDADVVEDEPTTRRTRSLSQNNSVDDLKLSTRKQSLKTSEIPVATPTKKSPSNEPVNTNLESIAEDEHSEEDEPVTIKKNLKPESTKLDLDLSVINEASLTEEDPSPEKKRKTEEKEQNKVLNVSQEKSEEPTATKETTPVKGTGESDKFETDSDHSFTLQLSVCENSDKNETNTDPSNKENVNPKTPSQDMDFEPMDVDDAEIDCLFTEAQGKFNSSENLSRENEPLSDAKKAENLAEAKKELNDSVMEQEKINSPVKKELNKSKINTPVTKQLNESSTEKEKIITPVKKIDTPVKQAHETKLETVALEEKISPKEVPKVNGVEAMEEISPTTELQNQLMKESPDKESSKQAVVMLEDIGLHPEKKNTTPAKQAVVMLEELTPKEKVSKKSLETPARRSPRINSPLEKMDKMLTPNKQTSPVRKTPTENKESPENKVNDKSAASPRIDSPKSKKINTPVKPLEQEGQKGRSPSPKKTPIKSKVTPEKGSAPESVTKEERSLKATPNKESGDDISDSSVTPGKPNVSEKENSLVNEKPDGCDQSFKSDITDKEAENETEKSQEVIENKQVTPSKEQEFEAESESEEDYASPVKKMRQYNSVSDDEVFTSKNKSSSDSIFERSIDSKYAFIQRKAEPEQKDVLPIEVSDSEEETSTSGEEKEKDGENKNKPEISVLSQSVCRRSSDRVSISLQETIKADEDKEANLSGRIHNMVDYFCSTIKSTGDVSINVSMEYAAPNSDSEEKGDLIEISMTASNVSEEKPQKGSKRRKICQETPNKEELKVEDEDDSAKKSKKRGSLVVVSPKQKSTPWKAQKSDTSSEESLSEDSTEESTTTNFEKFLNESCQSDEEDVSWKPSADSTFSELSTEGTSDLESDASDEELLKSFDENKNTDEEKQSKKTKKLFSISNYLSKTLPGELFEDTEDENDETGEKKKSHTKKSKKGNEDKTVEQKVHAKKTKKEKVSTFTESKTGKKLVPEVSEVGKKSKKRKHPTPESEEVPVKAKVAKKNEAKLQNVVSVAFKPSTGKSKKVKAGRIKPSTGLQSGWDVEVLETVPLLH